MSTKKDTPGKREAASADRAGRSKADAASAPAPHAGTALGNQAMQHLIGGAHAVTAEPEGAQNVRDGMGHRFGMSFAGVRLRTDEAAAQRAQRAGARAYTEGNEIGFAPGAYAPQTPAGRRTLAHEFAHVAQRRGGNSGEKLPPMHTPMLAEWQAHRAASSVMSNTRPRVFAFAGHAPLYDNGKGSADDPALSTSDDVEVLLSILKILETAPEGDQREGAIAFLAGLAVQPGPAQELASKKMITLLAGIPSKRHYDHIVAIEALKPWTAKHVQAYDLLLYGRFWFADHSQDEIGSGLTLGVFRKYLHYSGGKWAIDFLRRRINGADALKASLAARIVADLLETENDPSATKFSANYKALRAMARENGWDSYGALGVASATPRIFEALKALREQASLMSRTIRLGPVNDPNADADQQRLDALVDGLGMQGPLSRPGADGSTVLLYTAENREETEHALMPMNAASQAVGTLEMAQTITMAVDAGVRIQSRVELLHANAEALDTFLGVQAAANNDERMALFDLRSEYIEAWLSFSGKDFGGKSMGMALSYQSRLDAVERRFEHFDEVVAQRKFKTARANFKEYSTTWNQGNLNYPGNDKLDEKFFFVMRDVLEREREHLSASFATGFSGSLGGTRVRVAPSDDYIPTDLNHVAALHRDTSIFGMQSALFMVYAANLSIHNLMIKADVGSKSFRAEQGKRLVDMRTEMEGFWNKGNFAAFLDRTADYERTLKSVASNIKDRAKIDFLLSLGITLIAALVSHGAALAVRLASLSRILALARTARALSSVSTLMSVGVFTTSELALKKAVFGQDITVKGVAKAAATNLAFMGAMQAVGKLAAPLAQGSPVRQLMMGHLIGYSGVATVSATLTRIETGQWPPDMATFLAQTAITYLLIAGLHHSFQSLVAKPMLTNAATARWNQLRADAKALAERGRTAVNNGTLKESDFEAMRGEQVRLIEEARALHKVMRDGGLISAADFAAISKTLDNALASTASAKFPVSASSPGESTVKALPAPDSVIDLVRVGDTNTYVYDPAKPRTAVNALLERYQEKGFKLAGNDALTRVLDGRGRTQFLLTAGPVVKPTLLLPRFSGGHDIGGDPLSRATGLVEPQLATARAALASIHREIEAKLPAEYPDHTVLATFSTLLAHRITISSATWPIDAVRGVADALSLERGIPRSAVNRLFLSVAPAKLPELFKSFHDIVTSPKVSPGSRYLIADDLLPRNSVKLIDAWRQMQKAGLDLPPDMDLRATRGVARRMDKLPGGWLQWLKGIPVEQRGTKLRAYSGLNDPRVHLPENVTELLAAITADVPGHTGLNPLAGADGDAFVQDIESRASSAKFDSPLLRAAYVSKVDKLRLDAAQLQQGMALAHGTWENIVGRANEVRKIASVLLQGSEILVADRAVGPKDPLPSVDLAAYTLPGGGTVINAPSSKNVHMDLLYKDAKGTLTALEMTTGELTLPAECAALDPKNIAYGGDIDWAALEAKRTSATHRKFMQAIKIYQLNKIATALGTAWSGQPVDPAAVHFQAGDFSAAAARALESMGFQLELLDGTPQTAAQVEARKKGK